MGKDNQASFNPSKTTQDVISRQRNPDFYPYLNLFHMTLSICFIQPHLEVTRSIAELTCPKVDFPSRTREFFSFSHQLTIYESQIVRPNFTLSSRQHPVICLINLNHTKAYQRLPQHRLVTDHLISCRCFHGRCWEETRNIIPYKLEGAKTTRGSTLSHPFQPLLPNPRTLSHNLSYIPRTLCHLNVFFSFPLSFQHRTTYLLASENQQTFPYVLLYALVFLPSIGVCNRPPIPFPNAKSGKARVGSWP